MSLTDALDELVTNGTISPLLAVKVLMQFDKVRRQCSFCVGKGVSDAWSGCFAAPSDGSSVFFFSFLLPFLPCFRPLVVPLLVEAGGFVEGVLVTEW